MKQRLLFLSLLIAVFAVSACQTAGKIKIATDTYSGEKTATLFQRYKVEGDKSFGGSRVTYYKKVQTEKPAPITMKIELTSSVNPSDFSKDVLLKIENTEFKITVADYSRKQTKNIISSTTTDGDIDVDLDENSRKSGKVTGSGTFDGTSETTTSIFTTYSFFISFDLTPEIEKKIAETPAKLMVFRFMSGKIPLNMICDGIKFQKVKELTKTM